MKIAINIKKSWARSKIVCTLGPASNDKDTIMDLIKAGMDVVRINFSHGTHAEHKKTIENIRSFCEDVAILTDFCGPKIRIGEVSEPYIIHRGERLTLTSKNVIGTPENKLLSISHKTLPHETKIGDYLYINDGLIALKAIEVSKSSSTIECEVRSSGTLSSRKGLNVPEAKLSLFFPTKKDLKDINFALDLAPDFFALSFVRRADDVLKIRKLVDAKYKKIGLISKIEHRDAMNNIDEIIDVSDGIMIARGDLAIEVSTEAVPIIQKQLIRKCLKVGKPVITATQMLESMTFNQRPTRAEASDVANAIMDGSDAVMLSAETAVGNFPALTVETMNTIVKKAEEMVHQPDIDFFQTKGNGELSYQEILGQASAQIVRYGKINAILAATRTGRTPQLVSKYRPLTKIIAATPYIETYRKLQLVWGVIPLLTKVTTNTDMMIFESVKKSVELGILKDEDEILVIFGSILGLPSSTNTLSTLSVSSILAMEQLFTT